MRLKITMTDSMVDVLTELGVTVVNYGDREISARCPFHADNHPSFSMNAETGLWICYQCGERGTVEMLAEKIGGKPVNTTVLFREVKFKSIGKTKKLLPKVEDPTLMLARYRSFKNPPTWALEERFIDSQVAERYGIKWDLGWVIPIWEPEFFELLGWQFKQVDFVSNYPKAVKKSLTLFGLRELESTTVVLVESPLDVARLASAGVPAVASYGAFVSNAQVRLLVAAANKVILALDNDETGQAQTTKLYSYLNKFVLTKKTVFPKRCKDPGDMTDAQVMEVFG